MKYVKRYIAPLILAVASIIFTFVVSTYDLMPIAANGTDVGFATFNYEVFIRFGSNYRWYLLTEIIGYFALLMVAVFGLMGLVQLIKRKSLRKVDRSILCLAVAYVITGVLYVLFEKLVINYRPLLMPGELSVEASFPSSHTMLVCVVFGTAAIAWFRLIKNKALAYVLAILSVAMVAVMAVGRLMSGCHWATDIIGGLLYGTTIVVLYFCMSLPVKKN